MYDLRPEHNCPHRAGTTLNLLLRTLPDDLTPSPKVVVRCFAVPSTATGFPYLRDTPQIEGVKQAFRKSRDGLLPAALVSASYEFGRIQRSISPMTTSSEPTIAGMSAIRQPAQSGAVTDRLQNDELFARARNGTALSFPTM